MHFMSLGGFILIECVRENNDRHFDINVVANCILSPNNVVDTKHVVALQSVRS